MKKFITLLLICISTLSYAQYPKTTAASPKIEAKASELTNKYNQQLALTGIQLPLFKGVVEEYIMKSEKVMKEFDGREELDALLELQARETLEMNDILTQPQYRLYKQLKYDYQPLKVIDKQ